MLLVDQEDVLGGDHEHVLPADQEGVLGGDQEGLLPAGQGARNTSNCSICPCMRSTTTPGFNSYRLQASLLHLLHITSNHNLVH